MVRDSFRVYIVNLIQYRLSTKHRRGLIGDLLHTGRIESGTLSVAPEPSEVADLPVIFISAYRRDETVAQALKAGAVDYSAKLFSPTELVARVRAVLRRHAEPEAFVLGEIAIDYAQRRVTVGGEAVDLTATEYEVLRVLSLDAGRVVTFETLLRRVWDKRDSADAHLRQEPPPQARRQRGQPRLHLQSARRWLAHRETVRVEVEPSQMEVDGVAEPLSVAVPAGLPLDPLDLGVGRL